MRMKINVDRFSKALSARMSAVFLAFCPSTHAQDSAQGPAMQAPPPAQPLLMRTTSPALPKVSAVGGPTLYSIGDPSDEEQLYLELINRARMHPAQEGVLLANTQDPLVQQAVAFFQVDLALMVSQFAALPPVPPLSMSEKLTIAARKHSQDMFDHNWQQHAGSDGSTLGQRADAEGYHWTTLGENIYSYAQTVPQGHAGFEIDWGNQGSILGGMQSPPGHRLNIHSGNFKEVGVGNLFGSKGSSGVGPQLVTQDFGTASGSGAFVTGVAYYDINGNNAYDLGEGLGGVTVAVTGTSFYAVSANAGGYSVPVSANGNNTATFSVPGMADVAMPFQISNHDNVKVDLKLAYPAPSFSGPPVAIIGQDNVYQIAPLPGATGYQWRRQSLKPTQLEGAETGADAVALTISGGYNPIVTDVVKSGAHAFHLVHFQPVSSQLLQLKPSFFAGPNTKLTFQSRLGIATKDQIAKVEVSKDFGVSWEQVWSEPGLDQPGETVFSPRTVDLGSFAGKSLQVRFNYYFSGGSAYLGADKGLGWYLDDIQVVNGNEVSADVIAEASAGPSFIFNPSTTGDYALQARPNISGRPLDWSFPQVVKAEVGPPVVRIASVAQVSATKFQVNFELKSGPPSVFSVFGAPSPLGPWSEVAGLTIDTLGGGKFQTLVPALRGASQRYFKIGAN